MGFIGYYNGSWNVKCYSWNHREVGGSRTTIGKVKRLFISFIGHFRSFLTYRFSMVIQFLDASWSEKRFYLKIIFRFVIALHLVLELMFNRNKMWSCVIKWKRCDKLSYMVWWSRGISQAFLHDHSACLKLFILRSPICVFWFFQLGYLLLWRFMYMTVCPVMLRLGRLDNQLMVIKASLKR